MLIEAKTQDFAALVRGEAPAPYRLADSPVAPPEMLAMLAQLAEHIAAVFSPSAWMMVEDGEVVGLISSVQPLGAADRSLMIGYGVAPTRWGRGAASRAVAELVAWARTDDRIHALTAETSVDNPASQTVLSRNGFQAVAEREDNDDGPLIVWRLEV